MSHEDRIQRRIARRDRAMRAFWAPVLVHAKDITAGMLPADLPLTPENMKAVTIVARACQRRRKFPDGNFRDIFNRFADAAGRDTSLLKIWTKQIDRLSRYDFGDYRYGDVSSSGDRSLTVAFYRERRSGSFEAPDAGIALGPWDKPAQALVRRYSDAGTDGARERRVVDLTEGAMIHATTFDGLPDGTHQVTYEFLPFQEIYWEQYVRVRDGRVSRLPRKELMEYLA